MSDNINNIGGGQYHVVSFSGGKDSTAMLLHMIELHMPIDEIIFCDTTVEFPEMYEHIDKVEKYIGRPITRLKQEHSYEYYLLEHKQKRRKQNKHYGYAFPIGQARWCTTKFKVDAVRKHLNNVAKGKEIIQYVGIAADETKRIHEKAYPLVEWGWTEKDCLEYCYSKGFTWGGLYEKFHRLSCWCCPFKSLDELRTLYKEFPYLWSKLKDWQERTWNKFQSRYTVHELEIRFKLEEEREKQGLLIGRNREFHKELKKRIEEYNKEK